MDNKTKESIQFSSVILYLSLIRDMAGIGPLKQAGELNSRLGELLKEVGFLLDNQTKYNAFFDISCFTLITQSEEFGLFTVSKAIEEELNRSVSPYRETFLKDMDINIFIQSLVDNIMSIASKHYSSLKMEDLQKATLLLKKSIELDDTPTSKYAIFNNLDHLKPKGNDYN